MNAKAWGIFGIIVAAILGGMVYLSTQQRLDVADIGATGASQIRQAETRNGDIGDHILGNPQASVVMVEYGDYQCPGCATAAPEAVRLAEKYQDHLALVFRNFPLAQIHPNARAAAAAAEAAGLQGKFWEMHELIYQGQSALSSAQASDRTSLLAGYARQLGLDEAQFNRDLADTRIAKKIDFDMALGRLQQVGGTPAFYVNGELIKLDDGVSSLEQAVRQALSKQGVTLPADTAPSDTPVQ